MTLRSFSARALMFSAVVSATACATIDAAQRGGPLGAAAIEDARSGCAFSDPVAEILEGAVPDEIRQACLIVNLFSPPTAPAEQSAAQVEACLALEPKLAQTQDWRNACDYLVTLGVVDGMKIAALTAEAVRYGLDATYTLPRFIYHRGGASTGGCPDIAGSFYCPQTREIYLDLDQFARFREPAYVLAHEVVHDATWRLRRWHPEWPPYAGEHRIVYEQFADRVSGYTAGFHKDRVTDAFVEASRLMADEVGRTTQHQHGPASERFGMFMRGYNGDVSLPQFETGRRPPSQQGGA